MVDRFVDSCVICQKFQLGRTFLCLKCRDALLESEIIYRQHKGLDIFSLLHYVSPAQNLLKLCKDKKFTRLTESLGGILANKISYELLDEVCGVIPMPARRFGDHDHAYVAGEAAAAHFHVPLTNHFLQRASTGVQKEKSVSDREKISLVLREKLPLPALGATGVWLLVDDVVTTGATLIEAWRLLGYPCAIGLTLAATPRLKP